MPSKIRWIAFAAAIVTSGAWAGALYEAPLSSCGTTNCSGMTIRGIHQSNEPFVIQVYAQEGECLRLDVNTQTEDMVLAWITTYIWDSEIWDDRDFNGGDFRPLFVRDPVPRTGWYTVLVSYFDPDDRVGRFTLEYGRYPSGNANCQVPVTATRSMQPPAESISKKMFGAAAAEPGDSGSRE